MRHIKFLALLFCIANSALADDQNQQDSSNSNPNSKPVHKVHHKGDPQPHYSMDDIDQSMGPQ